MRLGMMMQDICQSFFKRPVTQRYPFERLEAPEHFRGRLHWDPSKCNGCSLCCKDCPANAIEILTIDKKAKRFVMRYHADRCVYCAQCVKNCRLECLGMSNREWELAALKREAFAVNYGSEADVEALLANAGKPGAPAGGAPAAPAD